MVKNFDGKPFKGVVTRYDPKAGWYRVRYEDGDEEELDPGRACSFLFSHTRSPFKALVDPVGPSFGDAYVRDEVTRARDARAYGHTDYPW